MKGCAGAWLLALAAPALAQAQAATPPTPTSVRSASEFGRTWLGEVLDLQPANASAAAYARISADASAPQLERQLAAARATELARIGAAPPLPTPDLRSIAERNRPRLEESLAQPSPPVFAAALAAARAGKAALLEFLAANGQLPQLRPFVSPGSDTDRPRMLRSRPPTREEAQRSQDRVYALQIVRAELEGRSDDAASLRRRAFPNWQPTAWSQAPAQALATAAANLEAWLADPTLPDGERSTLKQLSRSLQESARTQPDRAMQLLDRLPVVRERLQGPNPR